MTRFHRFYSVDGGICEPTWGILYGFTIAIQGF